MSNLSSLQQSILTWLITRMRYAEQCNRHLLDRGVDWVPEWTPKTEDQTEDKRLENVWRASLCRTLARFERRGLVKRIRGRKQARTARVLLTPVGHRIAHTLAATLPPTGQWGDDRNRDLAHKMMWLVDGCTCSKSWAC
jgi:hypothetical protein